MLRVANSSFYGLRGKVVTVQDAMVVLGFRNVRTLVMAAGVTGGFPAAAAGGFDLRAFWMHGIVTAVCARSFAGDAGIDPERAFTAGLLHDIGRVVLATCFPDHYRRVAEYRARHDCHPIEAERQILGLDHAAVGSALTERWKFAPVIQRAVAGHHSPPEAAPPGAKPDVAGLIHVADVAAHALDLAGDDNRSALNAVTQSMALPGRNRQRLEERAPPQAGAAAGMMFASLAPGVAGCIARAGDGAGRPSRYREYRLAESAICSRPDIRSLGQGRQLVHTADFPRGATRDVQRAGRALQLSPGVPNPSMRTLMWTADRMQRAAGSAEWITAISVRTAWTRGLGGEYHRPHFAQAFAIFRCPAAGSGSSRYQCRSSAWPRCMARQTPHTRADLSTAQCWPASDP